MNNYEERALQHKRVRMDADPPAALVQGNGLPLSYMVDNGHQISYQPYTGSYNAHYPPAEVTFGYGPTADLSGYAPRGLGYAPPAHQAYPPPPQTVAFLQQQQQQMSHGAVSPYEQHHAHAQHATHKPAWPPQPIMQPLQQTTNDQVMKNEMHVKQEIKVEPAMPMEPVGPSVIAMRTALESHPSIEPDPSVMGNQMSEDPPKIKIKTDIFKDEPNNQNRQGVITAGGEMEKINPDCDPSKIRQTCSNDPNMDPLKKPDIPKDGTTDTNLDMLGGNMGNMDPESGKSRISDSGNSTDSANKNKFQGFSDSDSSSSSEDETKIPNEIYFGTPDISTYRPKMAMTPAAMCITPMTKPAITPGSGTGEVKKRGRPKGSCNKPKPPGMVRPQVGRPRGGGHSAAAFVPVRPFKKDFSGIKFKRRWSDDCLDSSHIPNEVYFGDVPVSMEILFNYYDSHAEKEKHHHHSHHKSGMQTPGNVTMVYSSSDSSSDDSSDSDSTGTDNEPIGIQQPVKRGPGRPRGSKTINRRSDGPRLSSGATSPGDKPPGITEMKRFLKMAGVEYDYPKLVEGCISNKERVAALLGLLEAKGLKGPPTVEACRALYTGPPPRRRGPKPGTKRTPKASIATSTDGDPPSPKITPVTDEELRRVTRGQTSGKPRQRIVISSDEEDAHTPLSKLRTMR